MQGCFLTDWGSASRQRPVCEPWHSLCFIHCCSSGSGLPLNPTGCWISPARRCYSYRKGPWCWERAAGVPAHPCWHHTGPGPSLFLGQASRREWQCRRGLQLPWRPLDTQSCHALLAAAQAQLRGAADGSWDDLAGAVLLQPIVPVTMEKQMLNPALLKKQRRGATWGTAYCLRGLGAFDHTRAQVFPQISMPPKSTAAAS